jgi:predicted ATPase/DNA-binding winged helix-turn-helix (wHTH) protein
MESDRKAPAGVAFGRFLLLPHRRELLADGQATALGARAFDVLMALIEARGSVVSKDALAARVWPGQITQPTALQSQVSALRAVLGADRDLIRTVSGRGYQFVGEIRDDPAREAHAEAGAAISSPLAGLPPTNLPSLVSELIGRDKALAEVEGLAANHRLVTLTGAGGIGKTRLAIEAARRLLRRFGHGVWVVEFSSVSDPSLVPATIALAVGVDPGGTAQRQQVARALGVRPLLLLLDTCEHLVGVMAAMAEELLRAGAAAHIIATSREPLRAEGEWIYPVRPLAVPAEDARDDDLQQYGAVRLFIERAQAVEPHFAPEPHDLAAIAAICRRLDGIPLAIEMAAAQTAPFSVRQLVAHLHDRFDLLTGGRRTALPRHQTLRATLDWSYELLLEPERVIFRRLGIFSGMFSLEAAEAVAASPEIPPARVIRGLADLVAKSLVVTEMDDVAYYRLLDTTRAYALEELTESGEREQLARRHAEYYRDLFERAEAECETRHALEWVAYYRKKLNNLRVALDWAFSPGGEASVGVALATAAVPLWMHLSLLRECRGRVEQALAALGSGARRDARREMRLQVALGASLTDTLGPTAPDIGAAWTKALELADSLDDADYQFRSLRGLWSFNLNSGRHRVALPLAQRFCALAAKRPDPNDRLVGERMIGVVQFYLGDQASARRHLERVIADDVAPNRRSDIIRFHLDQRVATRVFLTWILWLQGFPDQAMLAAESTFEDAQAANHANTLCYALARAACPITLLVDDLAAAERYVGMLLEHSTRHGLPHWHAIGRCHQGALAIKRSDVVNGLRLLRAGSDELGEFRPQVLRLVGFLMAGALLGAGQIVDGLAAVEEALAWTERSEERWAIAELLRIKGELLLLQGAQGVTPAEDHFSQAIDLGRRQGALSWELRAATSLARLLRDQGRSAAARELLQPVYLRFTEGFGTADLKSAKALLDALG